MLLQIDRDGSGAVNGFETIFTISNGYTGGFTTFNFDGMIGSLNLDWHRVSRRNPHGRHEGGYPERQ